jgi:hypothetical protein
MMHNDGQDSTLSKIRAAVYGVFMFSFAMSIYAYVMLSSNPVVLPMALVIMTVLASVLIFLRAKTATPVDTAFEIASFLVFLAVILYLYRTSFFDHKLLLWTTGLYRPNYLTHGNRRVALVLSLLITAIVLPVTLGVVTDPSVVQAMTFLYAVLVLSLWVFCSKLTSTLRREIAP